MQASSIKNGNVIVISSVSGGGKTTIINRLIERYPELKVAITATSRSPRPNEVDGVHYFFYTPELFRTKIEADDFLEYAQVHGNYYGVPLHPVKEGIEAGYSIILNIDIQGMRTVRKRLGDSVITFFLMPPDEGVWEERLRQRGTDSETEIAMRLEEGRREMAARFDYDHIIVNDDLERALAELCSILRTKAILQ